MTLVTPFACVRQQGFTLVELLVVFAILALLALVTLVLKTLVEWRASREHAAGRDVPLEARARLAASAPTP